MAVTCGTSTITDTDGNIYNTVLIGDQCWMAENLRVGVMIDGFTNQTINGIKEKHCYNNILANCTTYGGLYQWNEMMQEGTGGLCPTGWHVPSWDEWQWLATILVSDIGGQMKTTGTIEAGTGLWYAPNTGATNSSGFNAVPGGWKDGAGTFSGLGLYAFVYSSQGWWYDFKYFRQLDNTSTGMYSSFQYPSYSMSVRCLRNATVAVLPTVSTSAITSITTTSAVGGGVVNDDGGAPVTTRGVVWSTLPNPTLANNQGITSDGAGSGGFTSTITGLAINNIYFVKAYATNSVGTSYGTQVEFTTSTPSLLTLAGITIGAGTNSCYNATQTITVAGSGTTFTVQTGGSVTLIAGQNIRCLAGTRVFSGGYLKGSIDPDGPYCPAPAMPAVLTVANDVQPVVSGQATFSVWPNPTTGLFTLDMDTPAEKVRVEIIGIRGETVLTEILDGARRHEFSLANSPAGVYFVRLISGHTSESVKIIKK